MGPFARLPRTAPASFGATSVWNMFASDDTGVGMAQKDIFWMACDSTEQLRAEYGPFHTRDEAEIEARKLGVGYRLRYEHIIGPDEKIVQVRCVFLDLQDITSPSSPGLILHTRCASSGEAASHDRAWQ